VVSEETEHRWLGYENPVPGRFVAVCSCGWRSAAFTSAGLAGSACDQHRVEMTEDPPPPDAGPPPVD
jgi:hypothetical protein